MSAAEWIDAWGGPLDALLDAARAGRVDLARVSMAALAQACLDRIAADPSLARRADQVALAATLTEMKARLLIPAEAAAAEREAERLRARLEALAEARDRAERLLARDRLGRDVFARGAPEWEDAAEIATGALDVDLLRLVRAYARLRLSEEAGAPLEVRKVLAMTLREALEALGAALEGEDWADLGSLMWGASVRVGDERRSREVGARSRLAAGFAAALELARTGSAEIREDGRGGVQVRRRERM
ncbi:MAG: segregation/condensation protein A [Pseudomonadota bacterium]